jgi:hypothetical protein
MRGVTYLSMPKNHKPLTNDRPVSFKMPSKLHAQIAKLAEADHRSVSNYLIKIAADHVAAVTAAKKGGK